MTGKRLRRGGDGRGVEPPGVLHRAEHARGEDETAEGSPSEQEAAWRRAMERAALELSGEVGYARMTVAALIERSGSNRERFYRTYGDKSRCYATAYTTGIEELAAGLLARCAGEPSWADGIRAALTWLAELVEAEPRVMKGLLGEAVAAARTEPKREEVFARLCRAVDRVRRESEEGRAPPPSTAPFVVHGIEASLLRCLDRPAADAADAWLEGALYIAVDLYLGPADARKQVRLLEGRG